MAVVIAQSQQHQQNRRRRVGGRLALLLLVTLGFVASGVGAAFAIPREATLARGQAWIDAHVPYSQTRYYAGYRTDCSGFVSMCWQLRSSYNTRTLYQVSHPISAGELQPGDALLRANYHVRLFAGWVDAAHTRYVAYEETGPGAIQTIKNIDSDLASGYIPYRYNRIEDGPALWNSLANGTFDVWVGDPVWWASSRDASGTVSWQRGDIVHTSAAALGVVNRSTDPNRFADVRQSLVVQGGLTYSLSAWAWTDRAPSAVRMRLEVLGSDGRTLVDTTTAGDAWGVGSAGMRRMAITQVMPSTASTATVTLRLAGGEFLPGGAPGTAAFDDVALEMAPPMAVYRFYNTSTGSHFYTASPYERDGVVRSFWSTFRYEGIAYSLGDSPMHTQNLYRFYNLVTGSHFYTASDAERDAVIRTWPTIFRYEGVAYKVAGAPTAESAAVYRFYNVRTGSHFYTASDAERDAVIRTWPTIFRYEGAAFHYVP